MTREHFDPEWKKQLDSKRSDSPEYKKLVEEQERIKAAFVAVARTTDGRTMFRALMQDLGFKTSTIPGKSIENRDDILCNETRRRVWIQLRNLLPVDLRNSIEQDEV